MRIYAYVDNSNVFIEGQRTAAVESGLALDIYDAMNRGIFNYAWYPDYGKLYQFLFGDNVEVGCAKLWGSPPPKDAFWQMVERKGFKVVKFDKSVAGKEKKVDVAIAHQLTKDAYTLIDKADSEIILVAGDKDFVPVVEDLVANGFQVNVYFWNHAARELKETATRFVSLNSFLKHLTR
ncbi:MAG: NYN domain-containing protein [Lyngbya sp. HA4199-MV5]|nr:NYN domain-containing protein [Lyngbya sp. HA4199-MV5]